MKINHTINIDKIGLTNVDNSKIINELYKRINERGINNIKEDGEKIVFENKHIVKNYFSFNTPVNNEFSNIDIGIVEIGIKNKYRFLKARFKIITYMKLITLLFSLLTIISLMVSKKFGVCVFIFCLFFALIVFYLLKFKQKEYLKDSLKNMLLDN